MPRGSVWRKSYQFTLQAKRFKCHSRTEHWSGRGFSLSWQSWISTFKGFWWGGWSYTTRQQALFIGEKCYLQDPVMNFLYMKEKEIAVGVWLSLLDFSDQNRRIQELTHWTFSPLVRGERKISWTNLLWQAYQSAFVIVSYLLCFILLISLLIHCFGLW